MAIEYRVLGRLEVRRDGETVDLGSHKQRSVLAFLLTRPNSVVATDTLLDEIWGEDGGGDKQNTLWVYISGLRGALDPERAKRTDGAVLLTRSPGYVLTVDEGASDALAFEQKISEARALLDSDPGGASLLLREGLALWRGRPYEDFTYEPWADTEIQRLEGLRLDALELRIEADLRNGDARENSMDDAARAEFLDVRELDSWIDSDVPAHEWGAEHVAEVLSWGLMDEEVRIIRIYDNSPEALTDAFRLVTGIEPLVPLDA